MIAEVTTFEEFYAATHTRMRASLVVAVGDKVGGGDVVAVID